MNKIKLVNVQTGQYHEMNPKTYKNLSGSIKNKFQEVDTAPTIPNDVKELISERPLLSDIDVMQNIISKKLITVNGEQPDEVQLDYFNNKINVSYKCVENELPETVDPVATYEKPKRIRKSSK
jgi:hypothetical protein